MKKFNLLILISILTSNIIVLAKVDIKPKVASSKLNLKIDIKKTTKNNIDKIHKKLQDKKLIIKRLETSQAKTKKAVKKSLKDYIKIVKDPKSSPKELADAQYNLGIYYIGKEGEAADYSKAEKYFIDFLKSDPKNTDPKNRANAQWILGYIYYFGGNGIAQNYSNALTYFNAFSKNDPKFVDPIALSTAQALLGYMYFNGLGTTQDYSNAFINFNAVVNADPKTIDQSSLSMAQGIVGYMYFYGLGADQDYQKSINSLNQLINNTNADPKDILNAKTTLAAIYYLGGNGITQDYQKVSDYLNQIINNSNADPKDKNTANYMLGKINYYGGFGVNQNYQQALTYFNAVVNDSQNASPVNLAESQYLVGTINQNGLGVTIDTTKAADYFAKALAGFNDALTNTNNSDNSIKSEIASANYYLGQMYKNGYGVTQDQTKAMTYFNKVTQDNAWAYGQAQAIINANKVT